MNYKYVIYVLDCISLFMYISETINQNVMERTETKTAKEIADAYLAQYFLNKSGIKLSSGEVSDFETVLGRLTNESWAKGEKIMAEKHREHYSDALSENRIDATTADVFFQLALMGEIVYD